MDEDPFSYKAARYSTIIKYGTMTNESGGVYTFRAAGTAFSNVRQTFQSGIGELTTINGKGLIGLFLPRS